MLLIRGCLCRSDEGYGADVSESLVKDSVAKFILGYGVGCGKDGLCLWGVRCKKNQDALNWIKR